MRRSDLLEMRLEDATRESKLAFHFTDSRRRQWKAKSMSNLRAAIFGWYHHCNAGDDRFAQIFAQWLEPDELIFLQHGNSPPLELLRHCDYVIYGGGSIGHLRSPVVQQMPEWIARCGRPVFVLGVTCGDSVQSSFQAAINSGGLIWLRDKKSYSSLGLSDHVFSGPDLTWLYPLRFDLPRDRSLTAVNLKGGGNRSIDLGAWTGTLKEHCNPAISWPLRVIHAGGDQSTINTALGATHKVEQFDPTVPSRVGLVAAMRYHAVVFALQACTPVVPIINTPKVQSLLDDLGLTDYGCPVERPEEFGEKVRLVRRNMTPDFLEEVYKVQHERAASLAERVRTRILSAVKSNPRTYTKTKRLRKLIRDAAKYVVGGG